MGWFLRSWRWGLDHQKMTGFLPCRIRKYDFAAWYCSFVFWTVPLFVWNSFLFSTQSSTSVILFFSLHNPYHLQFFPFLCTTIPTGFHDSLDRFLSCRSCFFLPQSKGNSWCSQCQLWKDRKKPHHPLITGK